MGVKKKKSIKLRSKPKQRTVETQMRSVTGKDQYCILALARHWEICRRLYVSPLLFSTNDPQSSQCLPRQRLLECHLFMGTLLTSFWLHSSLSTHLTHLQTPLYPFLLWKVLLPCAVYVLVMSVCTGYTFMCVETRKIFSDHCSGRVIGDKVSQWTVAWWLARLVA